MQLSTLLRFPYLVAPSNITGIISIIFAWIYDGFSGIVYLIDRFSLCACEICILALRRKSVTIDRAR